jgi:hypothetical protein
MRSADPAGLQARIAPLREDGAAPGEPFIAPTANPGGRC